MTGQPGSREVTSHSVSRQSSPAGWACLLAAALLLLMFSSYEQSALGKLRIPFKLFRRLERYIFRPRQMDSFQTPPACHASSPVGSTKKVT